MPRPRILTDEQRKENNNKARDNWNEKHKDKAYRYQKKSRAKSFILKDATIKELKYFQDLIAERLSNLERDNH